MKKLVEIADRIVHDKGLLLSTFGIGQLYRLREDFVTAIADPRTSADNTQMLDAAVAEVDLAIDMFARMDVDVDEWEWDKMLMSICAVPAVQSNDAI